MPEAYGQQFDLAVQNITNLVAHLTDAEIDAINRIDEPDTDLVAEISRGYPVRMTIGTEHEYSINDAHFTALPVSDQIIKSICGSFESEILFGDVKLGKELQKTVLEFIPRAPASGPAALESMLTQGIRKFYQIFPGQYHLLGLGMHPTLTPGRTAVWDHDEGEYYEAYDRLFQYPRSTAGSTSRRSRSTFHMREKKTCSCSINRIRTLLPYLIALTASSPMVEGRLTGKMDNRLIYYRENQKEIPQICNGIIPARIRSVAEYRKAQEQIFSALRARDAGILCEEWLNSSGLIIRFSRGCLEIKAPDEQECIRSDMAVAALVTVAPAVPGAPGRERPGCTARTHGNGDRERYGGPWAGA